MKFSDKGCRNKRLATGLTRGIVGDSVLPKCELDIPCVHFDKDRAQEGEVIITDVSHLPEGNFNLFSVTRLQKRGGPSQEMQITSSSKQGRNHCCLT